MAMQRKRRRRSGGSNNGNSNNPNRHYESNGPDVRIRGSAQQILEKYLQYAHDAQTSGDRVKAEALFQHAEHYARIVAVFETQKEEQRKEREAQEAARAEERAARAAAAAEEDTAGGTSDDAAQSQGEAIVEIKSETGGERAGDDTPAAEAEPKPKSTRRRASARKPKAPAPEEDGVMKTLARGAEAETVAKTQSDA